MVLRRDAGSLDNSGFPEWLERNFQPYIRPAEGGDVYRLLIYDGHESHITYEFIEYAYAHRICLRSSNQMPLLTRSQRSSSML